MPDTMFEQAVCDTFGRACLVAGVDEAGRGALAGPVTAASVILPLHQPELLAHLAAVNDSKQLRPSQRTALAELIRTYAVAWGVASVSAAEIDRMGILPATQQAMRLAVAQLNPPPAYVLVDGPLAVPLLWLPQRPLVRGDALSLSIAAASILAKVDRDQHMGLLDKEYPIYGLAQHKGYGTAGHTAALAQHGPTPIHRHTFAPLKSMK